MVVATFKHILGTGGVQYYTILNTAFTPWMITIPKKAKQNTEDVFERISYIKTLASYYYVNSVVVSVATD